MPIAINVLKVSFSISWVSKASETGFVATMFRGGLSFNLINALHVHSTFYLTALNQKIRIAFRYFVHY